MAKYDKGDCPETDEEMYKVIDAPLTVTKPKVKLIGHDGNAFAIMGACHESWKKAKFTEASWKAVQKEMMSGDYDHLLQTAMRYFNVS